MNNFPNTIISLPVTKAFLMADDNNRSFVISFHVDTNNYLYFNVTKSSYYPITKVPVFSGTCYSVTTVIGMLTAYGCSYIKRVPVKFKSVIPQDYFKGIVDGAAAVMYNPNPKTPCSCCCNCNNEESNDEENSEESSAEFFKELLDNFIDSFEEFNEDELPF